MDNDARGEWYNCSMGPRRAFNFSSWVAKNRHLLKPPVSNRHLFDEETDMVIMVIGGGNQRTDYHDDPAGEFFYQFRGDMVLKVAENGEFYDVPIKEGEVFYLPPHVRHSPQRPDPASAGLVLEGNRGEGAEDGFEWYCFDCGSLLHRVQLQIRDIVKDLPPLFEGFYADQSARTCLDCGARHPGPTPPEGWSSGC